MMGTAMEVENALVPELAVSDYAQSRRFYLEGLGFALAYERVEEGFGFFCLGQAQIMVDQIGLGRTFEDGHRPSARPYGRGMNLQIRCRGLEAILARFEPFGGRLYLPLEEATYVVRGKPVRQRQAVIADPDGYLLRFFEPVEERL